MKESIGRVLVVDDEPEIRRFLRATLRAQQYEVVEAENGARALEEMAQFSPDFVILDLGLPDMDGVEVTRRLRQGSSVPIVILSVRDRERDKIEALDAGADDYLTKPFGVGELMARLRVVARRAAPPGSDAVYHVKDLSLDLARHQASLGDRALSLTPTEFDLLKALVQNAGKVITHRQLIHKVWGAAYGDEDRLLRVNISNLRRKLEPDPNQPEYILTELGVGYRMRDF